MNLQEALSKIDDLQGEVTHYKRELGIMRSRDNFAAYQARWALTPTECLILDTLYTRRGRVTTKQAVMDSLYQQSADEPEIKIIDVYICKIRGKVGRGNILTCWGNGYQLGPDFVGEVDALLAADLSDIEPVGPREASLRHTGISRMARAALTNGPLTARQAGERLHVSGSRASVILNTQVKGGFVTFRGGNHIEGARTYRLTTKGRNRVETDAACFPEDAADQTVAA